MNVGADTGRIAAKGRLLADVTRVCLQQLGFSKHDRRYRQYAIGGDDASIVQHLTTTAEATADGEGSIFWKRLWSRSAVRRTIPRHPAAMYSERQHHVSVVIFCIVPVEMFAWIPV